MSSPTTIKNVKVSSTSGDTFTGPARIHAIKVVAGSATATASLATNSTTFWESGNVTTSTATVADEVDVVIPGGDTVTITLSGTGAKAYIYFT